MCATCHILTIYRLFYRALLQKRPIILRSPIAYAAMTRMSESQIQRCGMRHARVALIANDIWVIANDIWSASHCQWHLKCDSRMPATESLPDMQWLPMTFESLPHTQWLCASPVRSATHILTIYRLFYRALLEKRPIILRSPIRAESLPDMRESHFKCHWQWLSPLAKHLNVRLAHASLVWGSHCHCLSPLAMSQLTWVTSHVWCEWVMSHTPNDTHESMTLASCHTWLMCVIGYMWHDSFTSHMWRDSHQRWHGKRRESVAITLASCHTFEESQWQGLSPLATHFSWWVLQHCTGFARLVWGRLRVHRAFVYSDWFVCYVCFCSLLPCLTLLLSFLWTSCTASPARWECLESQWQWLSPLATRLKRDSGKDSRLLPHIRMCVMTAGSYWYIHACVTHMYISMRDTHMNIPAVPTLSITQLHVSLLSLWPLSITQLLSTTQLLSLLHNCSLLSLLPNCMSVYPPSHTTARYSTTASALAIAQQSTLSTTQLLSLLHNSSLLSLLHSSLLALLHNCIYALSYTTACHSTSLSITQLQSTRSTTQHATLSITQLCLRSLLPNCALLNNSSYSLSYPTPCQSTSLPTTQLHSTLSITQQSTLSLTQLHVSLLSLLSLYHGVATISRLLKIIGLFCKI